MIRDIDIQERTEARHEFYRMLPAVPSVVFNEDCEVGLKRFPNKYFDLAICDIPYGIDVANMAYLKEMNTTVKQKNGTRLNGNKNEKP